MFEYRVTKYNPKLRHPDGSYPLDDWTSVREIGRVFSGVILTQSEYDRVEDAYIAAANEFLRGTGVLALAVRGLENSAGHRLPFSEGTVLNLVDVGPVIRRILREDFWCRLEANESFVHIGWDYYMYIGVQRPCQEAERLAQHLGLFVEPCRSPHAELSDL